MLQKFNIIKLDKTTPLNIFKMFLALILLLCFTLNGCSSKPSEITYYHLNDTESVPKLHGEMNIASRQYVQLNTIKVPDYLKQSKLVLRTGPYKMHFSAANLWVQTPEKEIRAALLSDLNSQASSYYFVNFEPGLNNNIRHRLFVDITHFYPTENSDVLLNGYWTLLSDDDSRKDHKFQFAVDLNEDGYSHAVSQQRALISSLSAQIVTQIHGK